MHNAKVAQLRTQVTELEESITNEEGKWKGTRAFIHERQVLLESIHAQVTSTMRAPHELLAEGVREAERKRSELQDAMVKCEREKVRACVGIRYRYIRLIPVCYRTSGNVRRACGTRRWCCCSARGKRDRRSEARWTTSPSAGGARTAERSGNALDADVRRAPVIVNSD